MSLLDIFREDEEECDHEWESNGETYATAGPYMHRERDILYGWREWWEEFRCKHCGDRKTSEKTESKTFIWYADEIYTEETAMEKRDELVNE